MDPIRIFRIFRSAFVAMLAVWSASSRSATADEPGAERMEPSTIERVDRLFVKWDKPTSPGAVLAILKDGKIIYSRGYGLANLEENVSNAPSTVFHLASVSKQFTAFAIYLLADDGKLSLDDDVRKIHSRTPRLWEDHNNSRASPSYERHPRPMESSGFGGLALGRRDYRR